MRGAWLFTVTSIPVLCFASPSSWRVVPEPTDANAAALVGVNGDIRIAVDVVYLDNKIPGHAKVHAAGLAAYSGYSNPGPHVDHWSCHAEQRPATD